MGRAEKILTAQAKGTSNQLQVWDSACVARLLFPRDSRDHSKIRQTYRVLERARVVPDAVSIDELMTRVRCGSCREGVYRAIDRARSSRHPVSILQLREVRLGTFAVVWNNLRLARRWIWFTGKASCEQLDVQIASQLMRAHRAPCLLLFDSSAYRVRDAVVRHPSFMVSEIGSCGVALQVLNRTDEL